MAGNTVHVQGSYIDVHDNENVYLSVDKAEVKVGDNTRIETDDEQPDVTDNEEDGSEELCHFIHPSVDSRQEWQVHNEVKRLASRQGIQEICRHLQQMRRENKLLLPQSPSIAYEELVRMGMPSGNGFNESTFRKYYNNK